MTTPDPALQASADAVNAVARLRFGWLWPAKTGFVFAGVVLPICCFALGFPESPTWQSGSVSVYAQLLLRHKSSSPLYPFLIYHMVCMLLLTFRPERYVKKFVVRFGVYSGVLTALVYWVLLGLTFAEGLSAAAGLGFYMAVTFASTAVLLSVGVLMVAILRKIHETGLFAQIVGPLLAIGFLLLSVVGMGLFGNPLIVFIMIVGLAGSCSLICAPLWTMMCYGFMSIHALRHSGVERFRFSLAQLMGGLTWFAAYMAAWRVAVDWMLEEYAKLPTEMYG